MKNLGLCGIPRQSFDANLEFKAPQSAPRAEARLIDIRPASRLAEAVNPLVCAICGRSEEVADICRVVGQPIICTACDSHLDRMPPGAIKDYMSGLINKA